MKVVLLQTAIADYRDQFIGEIVSSVTRKKDDLIIYVGNEYFDPSIRTSDYVRGLKETQLVKNWFLFGRKVCFSSFPLTACLAADVVVAELNPRIINTWMVVLLRRLLRKRTVLWGHAWPRKGQSSKTDSVRAILRNISASLLVYTESQRAELYKAGYKKPIYVAPNSLYSRQDIVNVFSEHSKSIIYVGRLVPDKKVGLLVEAFSVFAEIQDGCTLEIVGAGPEMERLKRCAMTLGVADSVTFHGHLSNPLELKRLYAKSFVSVSPGYVGLSITQSFSFAIPMVVARDENHSPEIEALVPGLNGSYFDSDDRESLACMLNQYYMRRDVLAKNSDRIAADCAARYSVESMAEGFYEAVTSA